MSFSINLSDCIKWFTNSFLGTALTLLINLGRAYIFEMFSHSIQEQEIPFYLFKPIYLSLAHRSPEFGFPLLRAPFSGALRFFSYSSHTFVVKFNSKYFILFFAIVNSVVSNIAFCLLYVYLKAIDFYMLMLYPTTSLNSFIVYLKFIIGFSGVCRYSIISSANINSFTSSLPILMPLVDFSYLIVLANTLLQCWTVVGSVHSCLVSSPKSIAGSI